MACDCPHSFFETTLRYARHATRCAVGQLIIRPTVGRHRVAASRSPALGDWPENLFGATSSFRQAAAGVGKSPAKNR